MKQMVCSVCSYVYDEAKGIPQAGIAPETKWEDLPEDWKCPRCGAGKDAFREKGAPEKTVSKQVQENPHTEKELSPMEMSIICSNLARGCEKQYLHPQADAFTKLAEFFNSKAQSVSENDGAKLLDLVEQDLSGSFPYANSIASEKGDRGALRALTWSEKVTKILQVLLNRYNTEGEKMLENTGVFVCTICGFIFVGDAPPELCPVCKVPAWKFEKVEGRV